MHPVRRPAAPLVKENEPRERGKPVQEIGHGRQFPDEREVRDPAQDEDYVDGAVADHLVRDVDVAATRVPGPSEHDDLASLKRLERPRPQPTGRVKLGNTQLYQTKMKAAISIPTPLFQKGGKARPQAGRFAQ